MMGLSRTPYDRIVYSTVLRRSRIRAQVELLLRLTTAEWGAHFAEYISSNGRAGVIAEPLFVIPYNMYTTYASVYMWQLG